MLRTRSNTGEQLVRQSQAFNVRPGIHKLLINTRRPAPDILIRVRAFEGLWEKTFKIYIGQLWANDGVTIFNPNISQICVRTTVAILIIWATLGVSLWIQRRKERDVLSLTVLN